MAQKLTGHLVREIVVRGSRGGPLAPLADQLNHDRTHLEGLRIEGKADRLDDKLLEILALTERHPRGGGIRSAAAAIPVAQGCRRLQRPGNDADQAGRGRWTGRRLGVIIQVISGLGGVGKTQLAAAFVERHHEEFDVAAWVRAEGGGTADLAELAVALGLPVAGRTPPERAGDALVFLSNTDRLMAAGAR